jgi:hypothetical protein
MTKEEILAQKLNYYLLKISDVERGCTPIPIAIYRAMDTYAKQQVVAFQKWTNMNGWFWSPNQWINYQDEPTPMTTEELYSLFTTNI